MAWLGERMHAVVTHNFQEQMEYSSLPTDEPAWEAFYRHFWPNMVGCHLVGGPSKWQQWGVDRVIYTASGQRFLIDEKKRAKDYPDILLEEWSVWRGEGVSGNKIGWTLDDEKRCNFIAYAIPSAKRCYLLPFELLRQAFRANLERWRCNYRTVKARNHDYETVNVPVPWPELKLHLCQQMVHGFGCSGDAMP